MRNAILYGNGLNLLSNKTSWNELLEKISSNDSLITGIPNTMQYETVVLSSDYYCTHEPFMLADGKKLVTADGETFMVGDKLAEEEIKNKIKDELKNLESNVAYERLIQLNIEHFITTNYDQVLYNLLSAQGYEKVFTNNTENIYSIRRKVELQHKSGNCKYIWPIHGTIQYPKSIMLGLDQYCGSVAKINAYIKGGYNYNKAGKQVVLEDIISRLKQQKCDIPLSWIDLFFTHNIHIIGFGLQYDEIDLWWILNRRQRYIREYGNGNIISNKIIFYGNVEKNKKELLTRLGVEVCSFDDELGDDAPLYYQRQYNYYLNKIEAYCK